MINYSMFNQTDNHSFNVFQAISYCKKTGEDCIVFSKGEYHFYPDMAFESVMCVSNHDIYGFRSVAFLLEQMKGFCIDGGGSRFIFHGCIVPVYINQSSKITLKNVTIDFDKTRVLDCTVTDVNEKFFEVSVSTNGEYFVENHILNINSGYGESDTLHTLMIRSEGASTRYTEETNEEFFGKNPALTVEDIGNRKLRFYNSSLKPSKGMHLLAKGGKRSLCNIVINKSSDVKLDSIRMHSGYAMGVLAQVSQNITIDRMEVKAQEGKLFSLAADATHFVHCTGLVKVSNSSFSEQLDDALNVHGIFTKIVHQAEDSVIVRYMQKSAKGIGIYDAGDEISILHPKTLVNGQKYIIQKVEVINLVYTKLYLDRLMGESAIGNVVENLTKNCDLLFENNRVFNNRSRGMLIGTKGKVEIRNNYFQTTGSSVLFESDGEYWFESGGSTDVRIYDNTFEHCCVGPAWWGNHVIQTVPRKESVPGSYYHGLISITDNYFTENTAPLLYADNVNTLVFRNNRSDREPVYSVGQCGKTDLY